jgi:hypothetical protein
VGGRCGAVQGGQAGRGGAAGCIHLWSLGCSGSSPNTTTCAEGACLRTSSTTAITPWSTRWARWRSSSCGQGSMDA